MNARERIAKFFADGPKRTQWLNEKARSADDTLNYYLGPTGVPDKLTALGGLLGYTDAGDMPAAAEASRTFWNSPSIGNAAELAAAGAAMAIPFVGARMANDGVDVIGDAITSFSDDMMKGYDPSRTNIFGGIGAKTADKAALARAQELAESGVSRDDIWRDTGWFKGVDGKWRFEIDDSGAGLTDYAAGAISQNRERSGRIESILDHPNLEKAYGGKIGEVTVDNYPFPGGSYYPETGAITARGPEPKSVTNTLLHEGQHAIQGMEGFAQGSSPGEMLTAHIDLGRRVSDHLDAKSLLQEVERTGDWDQALRDFAELDMPVSQEGISLAKQFGDSATAQKAFDEIAQARQRMEPLRRSGQWQDDAGFGPYYRAAGEVEARNVQNRRDFTPEQRRATPPWETQDVPDDRQLLVFGNELQLSEEAAIRQYLKNREGQQ